MSKETYADATEVAARAAQDVIDTLSKAIQANGKASWALAGGTSPMAAYGMLASRYGNALDWSKVTILIGDERCVAHDQPDSNWGQISKVLFANADIAKANKLVPQAELGAEEGAKLYSDLLADSLGDTSGHLQLDVLWIGLGEDGHTLSLFPGHPEIAIEGGIMLPVHNSPKPPADRITLSLSAAASARKVVIFAVGAAKKAALVQVQQNPASLPIGLVAQKAEQAGNDVLWLYDQDAES